MSTNCNVTSKMKSSPSLMFAYSRMWTNYQRKSSRCGVCGPECHACVSSASLKHEWLAILANMGLESPQTVVKVQ